MWVLPDGYQGEEDYLFYKAILTGQCQNMMNQE